MFSSCSALELEDGNENDRSIPGAEIGAVICEGTKNYTGPDNKSVTTRGATVDVHDLSNDGILDVFTDHHMVVDGVAPKDTAKTYTGKNSIEVRGLTATKFSKVPGVKSVKLSRTNFKDYSLDGYSVEVTDSADYKNYFYLPISRFYDGDSIYVEDPLTGKKVGIEKCKNYIDNIEFLSAHRSPLGIDSIGVDGKFHAYNRSYDFTGRMLLKATTARGMSPGANNVFRFTVSHKIWVPENTGIIIPEDKPEKVLVEPTGREGFEFVNDSTDESWKEFHDLLSNGTYGQNYRIAVLLKHGIDIPRVDTLGVDNFAYTAQQYVAIDRVSVGNRYDKEVRISVQKYSQKVRTRSNHKDLLFDFWSEGAPIYTDSLGGQHRLPEKQWVNFADGGAPAYGWSDESMSSTEHYDRKKLLSDISASFNEHSHSAQGAVVLKKQKQNAPTIIGAEYTDEGIEVVSVTDTLVTLFSFKTKWNLFSDNTKERVGKIGHNREIRVKAYPVDPIIVSSWDIKDQQAKASAPTTLQPRTDAVKGQGTYTLTPDQIVYQTYTTQSGHRFDIVYDANMSLKDEYNKTIQFRSLELALADLGGVATLTDILPEGDYERKQMTSTIKVVEKATKAEAKPFTTVIFKKMVEKEELIVKPHKIAEGCDPIGGNVWRSYVTYEWTYKLAGKGTKTYEQNVRYGVAGRADKEVKADNATATYTGMSGENAWKAGAPFAGSETGTTVTPYTTVPTEDYTLFNDLYDGVKETAKFSGTLAGEAVSFDFPVPSISIVHATPSTKAGGEVTRDGQKYTVTEHTGPITAKVSYSGKSQNVSASDLTKILVKKNTKMPDIDPLIYDEVISVGKMVLSPRVSGGTVSTWDVTLPFNGQKAFHVMDCNTNKVVFTAQKAGAAGARAASASANTSWEQESDGSLIYTYGGRSWRIPAEALTKGGAGSSFEEVTPAAGARRASGTQTYTNVNGGINVNGVWKACWIEKASTGNAYVYRWGNGADYYVVPVNLFCIGGAAHLSESGNARQDPWVTTNAVPTTYDDGVIYTVTGTNNVGSKIRAIVKVGFKKE